MNRYELSLFAGLRKGLIQLRENEHHMCGYDRPDTCNSDTCYTLTELLYWLRDLRKEVMKPK